MSGRQSKNNEAPVIVDNNPTMVMLLEAEENTSFQVDGVIVSRNAAIDLMAAKHMEDIHANVRLKGGTPT